MYTRILNKDFWPLFIPIFGSHVKRIGFIRTFIGGTLMYLTIPLFIFLHVTIIVLLYNYFLASFLSLPEFKVNEYVILDRHRIKGLHWFDKFNCLFCGYANGIIVLMNDGLDVLSAKAGKVSLFESVIISCYLVIHFIFLFIGLLISTVVFRVLAHFLGIHRGSHSIINKHLRENKYANNHNFILKEMIINYKIIAMVVTYNLEQIESAWCPLKHIERKGYHLPEHHENFLERNKIYKLRNILSTIGTVSSKKPKW